MEQRYSLWKKVILLITEKLDVSPENPEIDLVKRAANYIKKGDLVAFPTETVYGLGANALDPVAVKRIFIAKGRPQDNPLIMHVSSLEMAQDYVCEDLKKYRNITDILLPGPVTLIFHRRNLVPDEVTAGLSTVGIRFPAHPVARKLIEFSEVPIAAPSANVSGKPSPTKAEHVLEDMDGKIECILMGGASEFGLESTIVSLAGDKPILLRPGPISVEQLQKILPDIDVPDFVRAMSDYKGPVLSPGMKYRHYSPDIELLLVEDLEVFNMVKIIKALYREKEDILVLCSEETADMYPEHFKKYILGSRKNLYEVGHRLFATLRNPPMKNIKSMVIESFPEIGVGLAIMNRLRKAAWRIVSL